MEYRLRWGINMHGAIKAAEKSAHPIHWKGKHVKYQISISRETTGQHKTRLLKGVCPSTVSEDRIHPLLYFSKVNEGIYFSL